MHFCGRAPYGARGLKLLIGGAIGIFGRRRAPYGARGLKYHHPLRVEKLSLSRPVWGAWIEIGYQYEDLHLTVGRAPYGARGLKLLIGGAIGIFGRVAPRMGRVD